MSDMVICPHCSHEHEPTGSHEDDSGSWECRNCKQEFECFIEYSPCYTTSKTEEE